MVESRCAQTVPAKRLYSIKELVAYFGVTPLVLAQPDLGWSISPTFRSAARC